MKTFKQYITESAGDGYWISHEGDIINVDDWTVTHFDTFTDYMQQNYPKFWEKIKADNPNIDFENFDLELDINRIAINNGWIHLASTKIKDKMVLIISLLEPPKNAVIGLKKFMERNPHDRYEVHEQGKQETYRTPQQVISSII